MDCFFEERAAEQPLILVSCGFRQKAWRVTRAVLFDLDGTFFDRDVAVRTLSETQYVAFERELTGVSREPFVSRLLELDAHGSGDKEMVYRRLLLEFELPEDLAPKLVEDFWGRAADPGSGRSHFYSWSHDGKALLIYGRGSVPFQSQPADLFYAYLPDEDALYELPACQVEGSALKEMPPYSATARQ